MHTKISVKVMPPTNDVIAPAILVRWANNNARGANEGER